MKFVLHRNTENRNQKIPFPAMQVAGLADAEQLTIQADAGSILISRGRPRVGIQIPRRHLRQRVCQHLLRH